MKGGVLTICFCLVLCGGWLHATVGYSVPWGKELSFPPFEQEEEDRYIEEEGMLTQFFEKVIRFHQRIISPVDGPRSHFRPSSSNYMWDAIKKKGPIRGWLMGCDRLLRENGEIWVYRGIVEEGVIYKWDPVN